jgi:hypothetical protein
VRSLRHLTCALALAGVSLAPAVANSTPPTTISFAVAGDHGADSTTAASLAELDSSGVDFYLAIGDLDYKEVASPADWCTYIKSRLPTLGPNFPFQLVAGNHEETNIEQHASCLPDRMSSTMSPGGGYAKEYYFDYPPAAPLVRVVMISPDLVINGVAYNYTSGSTRYNWVAGAIDDARADAIPWVVVAMHKHCFISGSSSCEIGTALMEMLVQKKVDLVIQGHKHSYQRGKQLALSSSCSAVTGSFKPACVVDEGADNVYTKGRGTIVLINGMFGKGGSSSAGGYFVKASGGDGFTKFTVSADRIDAEFVNATSSFTDSYSIVPNQPPTISSPGNQISGEGQSIALPITASDPEGDSLGYAATGLPPGLSINSGTGVITGTIAAGARANSPYSSRVTVTDDRLLTAAVQFAWLVNDQTPPATPASLTFTRHTTGVFLDWPDNAEVDLAGYNISRSPTGNAGTFTKLNASLETRSEYFDEGAAANATSFYHLTAVDQVGNASSPKAASARRSKIVLVGARTAQSAGSSLSIGKPDGAQPGDVLLAAFSIHGSAGMIPPLGWTLVSHTWHPASLIGQVVFSHTVAAGEPPSYTFSSLISVSVVATVVAYRGAIEQPSTAAGQPNDVSTYIMAPGITSTLADSVQVGFFGIAADAAISPPDGMLERGEQTGSSSSRGIAIEVADLVVDAGLLTARVATSSIAALNMGQVILLGPAP